MFNIASVQQKKSKKTQVQYVTHLKDVCVYFDMMIQ